MNSFKTSNHVHYYEMNIHREATPVALLNYLEETAIRHSESVGCGIEKLMSAGQVWMITRWSLKIKRYPRWMETIEIETWPSKFERFYATREFKINGEDGETIGVATSQWIFFDFNRKRPVRVPAEVSGAYGFNSERMIDDPFDELPKFEIDNLGNTENPELLSLEFRVRLSDIDTNNHVNNIKYVEWLFETVPSSVHQAYFPASIEVAYKKETGYGATIISQATEIESGPGEKQFLHLITNCETGNEIARARTVWKKR